VRPVDLNCDLGESFGAYVLGDDASLLCSVTSANVACGIHAGDPSVLRRTIRLAKAADVAIGAHPGYPDLVGFGRREMAIPPDDLEDLVLYQIAAVAGMARVEGAILRHVKPHGALYNMAARDSRLARAIARAVVAFDASLRLYVPSGSALEREGGEAGLQLVREAFIDRLYEADGTLTPRGWPGAVLTDPADIIQRAIRMVRDAMVISRTGEPVRLAAETLCIHGDTLGAARLARDLREALRREGILVQSPA
jgi:UPF0271 protein